MTIPHLTFQTPGGALLALAVALPVAALLVSASRSSRGRHLLGLAPPESRLGLRLAPLLVVPLLLGLAAAGPILRTHVGRRVRTDAQAIFVFDTSRSMGASRHAGSPTRLAQARAAAMRLRDDAIPDVPSGVASLTTQILPHLFPTADAAVFDSTVENVIGIEKPPPPYLRVGFPGTSFWPLTALSDQGFFDPSMKHRFVILLTDGESGPFPLAGVAAAFSKAQPPGSSATAPGQVSTRMPQRPPTLLVVRIGSSQDRIYRADGSIEAAYRPDPRAPAIVRSLVTATHGEALSAANPSAAASLLRKAVGTGHGSTRGTTVKNVALAPYIVLLALVPLALIIWGRTFSDGRLRRGGRQPDKGSVDRTSPNTG